MKLRINLYNFRNSTFCDEQMVGFWIIINDSKIMAIGLLLSETYCTRTGQWHARPLVLYEMFEIIFCYLAVTFPRYFIKVNVWNDQWNSIGFRWMIPFMMIGSKAHFPNKKALTKCLTLSMNS